jgi:hypothetical protein
MDNATFETITNPFTNEELEYATIDHGNDQFTSMTKAEYDRQKTALSKPIVSSDE